MIVGFGVERPVHLQEPAFSLLTFCQFFLAVAVEGGMVVTVFKDARQIRESSGAILIFSEPLKFLLDLRLVVISRILVWTMRCSIRRYIFPLIEWTRREMIPLAMRVHLLVFPIIQA